ncbi:hypothetical protein [Chryseobacterium sp. MP_3.2]|uniref:hypothetical protein n=1 Tax=Chryseobacterium sp. MP_3.2 TaxID=3071712 RepID=UPI002DF8BD4C|nr:hypothetical protein [Chryseobacterium sp. MP_3.2]
MTFEEAYTTCILGKKIISWGFQQPVKTHLPNGYYVYPAGYSTVYDNNYLMIFSGASLEKADSRSDDFGSDGFTDFERYRSNLLFLGRLTFLPNQKNALKENTYESEPHTGTVPM